jgi:AraC-like DNA-binding protein
VLPSTLALWTPESEPCQVQGLGGACVRRVTVALEACAEDRGAPACRVVVVSPLLRELAASLDGAALPRTSRRERLAAALMREELQASAPLDIGIPLPSTVQLRAACETIVQDGARDCRLPTLAGALGIGPRSLARQFKQELATPFGQWRSQVRLARAVELWAEGHSVGASAAAVGYDSPSAFSFMVRRQVGMTPRALLAPRGAPARSGN